MASAATHKKIMGTHYWKELQRIAADLAGTASENGLLISKIAAAAGLSPSTVRNLFDGTTVFPHWRTMWCISASQGLSITPVERTKPLKKSAIDVLTQAGLRKKKQGRRKGKAA